MKKEQFYKLLENPNQASTVDIKGLEKVLDNNPYFTAAKLLYSKIQIERKNSTASEELEKNGISFPNGLLLEDWSEQLFPAEPASEQGNEKEKSNIDVTKEIIEVLPTVEEKPAEPEQKAAPTEKIPEKPEEKPEPAVEKVSVDEKSEPIEKPSAPEPVKTEAAPPPKSEEKPVEEKQEEKKGEQKSVESTESAESESSSDDIASEVMKNMMALRKTLQAMDAGDSEKKTTAKRKPAPRKPAAKKTETKTPEKKPTAKKEPAKSEKPSPKASPKKKAVKAPEKVEKKKERQKRLESQRNLIKDFIKNPPDLKPEYKGDGGPNEDLATVSTSENRLLVSESLAKILTRQGKHQKAIEVYEQLMLKYPKKRSYFAAQIKNLKE